MKYELDMTSGNLLKKIIIYTIPLMLTGILQLLYNACDVIVVGQFAGDEALAAVGSTGALINLIVNLFVGLSLGGSVSFARSVGMRDYERANKTVHTAVLISLIAGIVLTFVGIFGAKQFLIWMDSPSDVLPLATLYVQIYFAGMIFNLLYNFASGVVRANGDTKRPLIILSIAGVINVLLNLIFVIFLHMSVAGVALATIISQAFSAVAIMWILIKEQGHLHFDIKKLGIDSDVLKEMVRVGLPSGIQGSLFSISNVIIQSTVNSFGKIIVAGNAAAGNVEGFVYTAMNSFSQTALNFSSQNVGAKKHENTYKTLLYCLLCVTCVGLSMGVLLYFLGPWVLQLYTKNPEVMGYSMLRMKYVIVPYFLCGIMDVFVGGLRGVGSSIVPMIVSLMGACVFRIVWIFTVFAHYNAIEGYNSLPILYSSYPISWFLTAGVLTFCYLFVSKKLKIKLQNSME